MAMPVIFRYSFCVLCFLAAGISRVLASSDPAQEDNVSVISPAAKVSVLYEDTKKIIDNKAVENARNARLHLLEITGALKEFSPKLGAFLEVKVLGIRIIQYIASGIVLALTAFIIRFLMAKFLRRIFSDKRDRKRGVFSGNLAEEIKIPINILAWTLGVYVSSIFLFRDSYTIAHAARAASALFTCAILWLGLLACDLFFSALGKRAKSNAEASIFNLVEFLRRVSKCVLITIAAIFILDDFGLNVASALASIGIGGIALAFAAQDTIANFFGSISIIFDRPFIVGDWVKVSAYEGNVESVGFRSTRIRTFHDTVITIPNSSLAKESVENFSKMTVRKVERKIGLSYDTTARQMDEFLPLLKKTIEEVEGVSKYAGIMAEFTDFGDSTLDVSIVYYSEKTDRAGYNLTIRRVNIAIMELVRRSGMTFAFPSISVYNCTALSSKD